MSALHFDVEVIADEEADHREFYATLQAEHFIMLGTEYLEMLARDEQEMIMSEFKVAA